MKEACQTYDSLMRFCCKLEIFVNLLCLLRCRSSLYFSNRFVIKTSGAVLAIFVHVRHLLLAVTKAPMRVRELNLISLTRNRSCLLPVC